MLNRDPNIQRRALAIFLVGHFQDPEEIISILSQHVNDKNYSIRNNAMRVIAETLRIYPAKINIEPFVNLLNSPYGSDRNKALSVIFSALLNKKSRAILIKKGQNNLIALLQLNQPNNQEYAYLILKKISGKNYAKKDISSWKEWLAQEKKQEHLSSF